MVILDSVRIVLRGLKRKVLTVSEYNDEALEKAVTILGNSGYCPIDVDLPEGEDTCNDCQACWIKALKGGANHE